MMNGKMIIGGVAMAGILGFAPGATAKTLQGLLYNGSYSTGTTFSLCNGSSTVWAQASGWDSGGSLRCFVRAFGNNSWVTTTGCDASAVQSNASLRATGTSFCTSPMAPWTSGGQPGGQVCSVPGIFLKPNGGACVNVGTTYSFSNTF